MTGFDYDASPMTADVILSSDDVEGILATEGRGFIKDPRKVLHFVRRVGITMGSYRQQIHALHRDVQDMRQARDRSGVATTLNPIDAVRYLTPEQLASVFDSLTRDKLASLDRAKADAVRQRGQATAELNRIKLAVVTLLEDPAISPDVKKRFAKMLAELPAEAPPAAPAPQAAPPVSPPPAYAPPAAAPAPSPLAAPPSPVAPAPAPQPPASSGGLDDLFN